MAAAVLSNPRPGAGRRVRRLARRVVGRTVVRPLRRAVAVARATHRSVCQDPQVERLLSAALADRRRVLVVGPAQAVRRALPQAVLDVVGTDPTDLHVSVVSRADGTGSLPRRWDCVVVTDVDAPDSRLHAAVGACMPGGTVAAVTRRRSVVRFGSPAVAEVVSHRRSLALHRARISA